MMGDTVNTILLLILIIGVWRGELLHAAQFVRDAIDIIAGDKKLEKDGTIKDVDA